MKHRKFQIVDFFCGMLWETSVQDLNKQEQRACIPLNGINTRDRFME